MPKLTSQASHNLTEALRSIETAANHLYQFHALGRQATEAEVEELEKKLDEIQYTHINLISKVLGEQKYKLNKSRTIVK